MHVYCRSLSLFLSPSLPLPSPSICSPAPQSIYPSAPLSASHSRFLLPSDPPRDNPPRARSDKKDTFPLKWDVSVGGHITSGDDVMFTAIKETEEELGVEVAQTDLQFLATIHTSLKGNSPKQVCALHAHLQLSPISPSAPRGYI
jgi:hypothetical protein